MTATFMRNWLVTLGMAGLVAAAMAQTPEVPKADAQPCPRLRKCAMMRFDADKDGVLSETERAAAQAARAERLARCDANGNGQIDPEERKSMRHERRQQHLMARFDQDGDGVLNETEKAAAAEARQSFLEKHDTNGNGQIDPDELPRRQRCRECPAAGDDVTT